MCASIWAGRSGNLAIEESRDSSDEATATAKADSKRAGEGALRLLMAVLYKLTSMYIMVPQRGV
jgi:hypothetical protein